MGLLKVFLILNLAFFLTMIFIAKSHNADFLSLCRSASSKGSFKLLKQLNGAKKIHVNCFFFMNLNDFKLISTYFGVRQDRHNRKL